MRDSRAGRILVGNCSWTDPTLIASGGFYPPGTTSPARRLAYYATQFPIVEVDSTFYAPPDAGNAVRWAERTPPGFVFDVKAFALLTGHGAAPERLTPELKACLPAAVAAKRTVYLRDLPPAAETLLWDVHRLALAPLHAAGKLGVVLFQFPPWYRAGHEGREHIRKAVRELHPYRVAVEFRGGGWLTDDAGVARTLSFLEAAGASYVSVDEPQGFDNSTPPLATATSDLAVVRFHGRNSDTWQMRGKAASDRFNYLYRDDELAEWVPQIRALAESAATVHVLFNNNYRDYGVRNARRMTGLLGLDDAWRPGGPASRRGTGTPQAKVGDGRAGAPADRRAAPGQQRLL